MTDNFENNDEFENGESFGNPAENDYSKENEESVPYYSEPISSFENNEQGGYRSEYNYQNMNRQGEQFRPYDFDKKPSYASPAPSPYNPDKKPSKGKKVIAAIIVLAVVIGLYSAVKSFFPQNPNVQPQTTTTSAASQNEGNNNNETQPVQTTNTNENQVSTTSSKNIVELSAVDVAQKARPSVVGVMTYRNGQLSGEGSGVAMGLDSSGKFTYIITCAHVINENGATFGVRTLEGKNYTAQMVASDVRTDIGVLKVEATDIPLAEFGDSTAMRVGETVYAIGNPGGSEYFGSITNGIVSAIDRSVSGTYTMTCIQHNAAINPGNSGGALVNSAGQVIGINSSKIAATDYEGMGFAVPMAIVKPVVDNLISYGYVPNRPKLGIEYASVDSYQLYSMVVAIKGLPTGSLVIAGISEDSSLAGTDAQVGDLIIAVNGKKMNTSDVLLDLISTGNVGDTLTLTLCRVENKTYKTSTFDVTITLIEDKGTKEETTTAQQNGGYYYGGASSFEDFFEDYFGF